MRIFTGRGVSPPVHLYDIMYLNHYAVKSVEDFKRKQARGAADTSHKSNDFLELINMAAVNTCPTLQKPPTPFSHLPP